MRKDQKEQMSGNSEKEEGLGRGVYYAAADYIGLATRFTIIFIDLTILAAITIFVFILCMVISPELDVNTLIIKGRIPLFLMLYSYLALIKRTQYGTVGYRVFRAKVVDLRGRQPSIWQMTLRFLLAALGPLDFILDTFWLGGDENKQTFRDKLAATYVVKRVATPKGEGRIELTPYDILGWGLLFREVKR